MTDYPELRSVGITAPTAVQTDVAAVLAVVHRSKDAEEARELLSMLGLLASPERREDGRYCPTLLAYADVRVRRAEREQEVSRNER